MISFSVLGRELLAEVENPELRAWLLEQWHFAEHAAPAQPYAIRIQETEGAPEPIAGTAREVALHRMTLSCVGGDGVWSFGDEAAGVRLRLAAGGSHIQVWGLSRRERLGTVFAALFLGVVEAVRASGLMPLHAAVAGRDGTATAFTGTSGAGKSTTLLRAIRAGAHPLAEDFAWLEPATLTVYGWDRGLRLLGDAWERFATELSPELVRRDGDGKLFVAYEHLPTPPIRTATLARLVVLERDEAGAEKPVLVRSHHAVAAWWEAVGVPLSPVTRSWTAGQIASLVRRVDCCRVWRETALLGV